MIGRQERVLQFGNPGFELSDENGFLASGFEQGLGTGFQVLKIKLAYFLCRDLDQIARTCYGFDEVGTGFHSRCIDANLEQPARAGYAKSHLW